MDLEQLPDIWKRNGDGDLKAEAELVEGYLWLARKLAYAQHIPDHVDREDLVSWASKGLLEAVRRFDAVNSDGGLHRHFMAYASQRIRGAILDGIKSPQTSWAPRAAWRQIKAQREAEDALSQTLGRPVTQAEVAAHMGLTPEKMLHLRLQIPVGSTNDGDHGLESVAGVDHPDQDASLGALAERVASCLARLPPQGQLVMDEVVLRKKSLGSVARHLGLSIAQVREIREETILALRLSLRE